MSKWNAYFVFNAFLKPPPCHFRVNGLAIRAGIVLVPREYKLVKELYLLTISSKHVLLFNCKQNRKILSPLKGLYVGVLSSLKGLI